MHPFTIGPYDTFMQKVRVETSNRNKSNKNMVQVKAMVRGDRGEG